MGFNIQSDDTQNTLNDFTSVVNTAVEKAKNSVSQTCTAANNITVLSGSLYNPNGPAIPCPTNVEGVTINQVAQANCDVTGDFKTQFQNSITTNVKTDIEQWIKANLNSNQGWLAIAFSAQSAVNQNAESVATTISNGLTADITNTCSSQLEASNNAIVSICGNYRKDFNFNQSAFVTNVTSCIANNTVSFIANNSILNDMSQHADSTLSSTQEGVFDWLKWVIIGGVIIAALIIVGVLLYFIFGSKSSGAPGGEERKEFRDELKRRLLEKQEGGVGSSSRLKEIENLGEERVK